MMAEESNTKTPPKHLTNLPAVGEFVGRQKELKHINELLEQNKPVVVVNGLGGVGKTTLALQYARLHAEKYTHIAWVRQELSLVDAFAFETSLHQCLHLPIEANIPPLERAKMLIRVLATLEGTHLLVIDNFAHAEKDDLAHFLQLFPFGGWRVLFTSREFIPQFAQIDLEVLPVEDALELFYKYLVEKEGKAADLEEARALVQYVGCHTLTVELLAKTYNKSLRLKSVGEMLDLLRKQELDADILQKDVQTQHKGARSQVYAHLLYVFNISGLGEKEHFVLQQFAALPTMAVESADFFAWIRDEAGAYEDSLLALYERGWLTSKEGSKFTMHPLVQMLIRKQCPPHLPACENLLNSFLALMDLDRVMANFSATRGLVEVGEAFLQYIDFGDALYKKGGVCNKLGTLHYALGDYKKAVSHTEESLALLEKSVGKEDKEYLDSLHQLAFLHQDMEDYAQALPLYEECLQKRKEILGEQHPDYLVSLSNLGFLHHAMGNYLQALPLYEECLQKRREVLGEQHLDYINSLNSLGVLYEDMEDYAQALPLYEECLQKRREVLGTQHPSYLAYLDSLGALYFVQRDSLHYFEEAYQEHVKVLGLEHPDTKDIKLRLDRAKETLGK